MQVMEGGFDDLDAPVRRLTGAFTPMPYSQTLESAVVPNPERIARAIRDLLAEVMTHATVTGRRAYVRYVLDTCIAPVRRERHMANEMVMPRLGWTMETGQVVQWLKHDGDTVKAGDILLEVEGDKAITEVEALDSGVLRLPPDSPEPGVDVPVGAVLAYLVAPGEPLPFAHENGAALTLYRG